MLREADGLGVQGVNGFSEIQIGARRNFLESARKNTDTA